MSHGGGGGEDKIEEPNLTPLLDLVLQLVMFFMICANFVMEQINDTIKLPEATAARSLEAKQNNILFLNINAKGHVLFNADVWTTPNAIESGLLAEYRIRDRVGKGGGPKAEDTLVIVRADKDSNFEQLYRVLRGCKKSGFNRLQLRAIIANSYTG